MSLAAWIAIMFASCEKEPSENTAQEPLITEGPDYLRVEREYSATTKKGYATDYAFPVEQGSLKVSEATDTQGNRYKTLGIKKPNGKFFYIMIENFRYNDGEWGSWDYGHNASNRAKYGRLYYWEKAAELGSRVSMDFPGLWPGTTVKVRGKLPTRQHFAMMLNKSVADKQPDGEGIDEYVNSLTGGDMNAAYFDLFTFGIGQTELEGGYHSLGGKRDNLDFLPGNIEFREQNGQGFFWSRDASSSSGHYPLQVLYKDVYGSNYNYSAFINAGHHNHYAYSVRYVFDPNE